MDHSQLMALAKEFAKNLKTDADLNEFSKALKKLTVETALNAELTEHLGHERHQANAHGNARKGYSKKQLLTSDGEFELNTPRDRDGTFEPQLVKKHQTRIISMDSQILSLNTKGMTTREIVSTFKELYDADVSASLISKVTDAVKEQVIEWQNRPLDSIYPIVYLDCIVVKVRQDNSVIRQATKKRRLFPTDDSVRKVIYLAIEAASKKWNMPIRDWRAAMNRFMIEFEGRLDAFI